MKLFTLLVLSTLCVPAGAETVKWKDKPEARKLLEQGFLYSAMDAHVHELADKKEMESADLELLEELVLQTNIEALEDYDLNILKKLPVSSIQFSLGRAAWREKKFKEAKSWLTNVPRWHRYYPEARFLLADMASDAGKVGDREAYEEQCYVAAEKRADEVKSPVLKKYYLILGEDCRALRARKLYKAAKYPEALEAYAKIGKRSYKWPHLLLEKAWAYYNMKDYNRALGLLVTYKSPLLSSYFKPEAEVLTALGYFQMCLYQDALVVIDQYYSNYKPRTEALETILNAQKNSQTYFYDLLKMKDEERNKISPFVGQLANQIRLRPRFSLDEASIAKVRDEMNRLARLIKSLPANHAARPWMQDSLRQLKAVRENLVGRINYHAKRDMFEFISEVYMLSEEMFKIKLEILSRKKDLVYASKKLISDRGRGDLAHVKLSRFEMFWRFKGDFWADELGDFSFGLISNCETVRKEAPSEEQVKE